MKLDLDFSFSFRCLFLHSKNHHLTQGNKYLISVPQIFWCGVIFPLSLTIALQLKPGQFHSLPLKSGHLYGRYSSFTDTLCDTGQAINGYYACLFLHFFVLI